MKLLKNSVILCGLLLSACSKYPITDEEVIQHYYDNVETYQSLAKQVCSNLIESKNRNYLTIGIRESNDEYSGIVNNLRSLGRDSISFNKVKGECSLEVIYDAFGLGGSATVYSLKYNVEEPIPYDKNIHTFEKRKGSNNDISFDIKLSNEWYFSFSQN